MKTQRHPNEKSIARFSVWLPAFLAGLLMFAATETSAQAIRRPTKMQRQIQKKLDKQQTNVTTPVSEDSTATPKPAETGVKQEPTQSQYPNLDGIRNRNILSMFSREEAQMIIPGFGRPPALLIIFRQLQLTPEQKEQIKAIRLRTGDRLAVLQRERAQLEQQIEDTIYGENFSVERVDELAGKAGEKQSEIIKIQAGIEARFRQILTPDQFYVFQFLIGEMVMPQRRVNPQQMRQQQLRRLGPNAPTRPPFNEDN